MIFSSDVVAAVHESQYLLEEKKRQLRHEPQESLIKSRRFLCSSHLHRLGKAIWELDTVSYI